MKLHINREALIVIFSITVLIFSLAYFFQSGTGNAQEPQLASRAPADLSKNIQTTTTHVLDHISKPTDLTVKTLKNDLNYNNEAFSAIKSDFSSTTNTDTVNKLEQQLAQYNQHILSVINPKNTKQSGSDLNDLLEQRRSLQANLDQLIESLRNSIKENMNNTAEAEQALSLLHSEYSQAFLFNNLPAPAAGEENPAEVKPAEVVAETKATEAAPEVATDTPAAEAKPAEVIAETKATEAAPEVATDTPAVEAKPAEVIAEAKATEAAPEVAATDTETTSETAPVEIPEAIKEIIKVKVIPQEIRNQWQLLSNLYVIKLQLSQLDEYLLRAQISSNSDNAAVTALLNAIDTELGQLQNTTIASNYESEINSLKSGMSAFGNSIPGLLKNTVSSNKQSTVHPVIYQLSTINTELIKQLSALDQRVIPSENKETSLESYLALTIAMLAACFACITVFRLGRDHKQIRRAWDNSITHIKTGSLENDEGNSQYSREFNQAMEPITNKISALEQELEIMSMQDSSQSDETSILHEQENQAAMDQIQSLQDHINLLEQNLSSATTDIDTKLEDVLSNSNKGKKELGDTVTSLQRLVTDIENAGKIIDELKEHSQEIGHVVVVIRGIAEQTNLLALNAAIEAARAGEQGRGFAVVADEVRTLASRTQQSTEEIESMIVNVQSATEHAVSSMSQGRSQVDNSLENANQAVLSISSIDTSIEDIIQANVSNQ